MKSRPVGFSGFLLSAAVCEPARTAFPSPQDTAKTLAVSYSKPLLSLPSGRGGGDEGIQRSSADQRKGGSSGCVYAYLCLILFDKYILVKLTVTQFLKSHLFLNVTAH